MSENPTPKFELPTSDELEIELKRVKRKDRFRRKLASSIGVLMVVSALAVLVASFLMPVVRIYGDSMSPALHDSDIVAALSIEEFSTGDIIAFHYENKVLVKRVIAQAGDWVNISSDGTVFVNGVALSEPYLEEKALGNCNISLPYQVPESHVFVMGDHRAVSVDSRNTSVGCVAEERIVGKLVVRVWPFERVGVL